MRRINNTKKIVLIFGAGLTVLGLLAVSGSGNANRLAVWGTGDSIRDVNPDHRVEKRGKSLRELTVPTSWTGLWNVTTTYRDASIGKVVASDSGTEQICVNDEVGLSSFITNRPREKHFEIRDDDGDGDDDVDDDRARDVLLTDCSGEALDDHVEIECRSRFISDDCFISFVFRLRVEHTPDHLKGLGEWRVVNASGNCTERVGQAEAFEITGTRASHDLTRCTGAPSSLIEKFVQHPNLILLLQTPIADLAAQAENKTVDLSWTAPDGSSVFKIFRATPNRPFELIAVKRARRGSVYRDHNVQDGVRYRYFIRWLDREGRQSPNSNETVATAGDAEN